MTSIEYDILEYKDKIYNDLIKNTNELFIGKF